MPDKIRQEQMNDSEIAPVIELMKRSSDQPSFDGLKYLSSEAQQLRYQWDSLKLHDSILYREFINPDYSILCYQLIVPRSLRTAVIMQLHAGVGSLHQSLPKCIETLKRFAWWKTMRSDTEREIRKCDVCDRSRKWPHAKHGPLQNWPASRPFQRAHVDLCGEFPMSRNSNKYCLTYRDYFSKYLIAIPLKDKSALTVAQALVEHVYLKLGLVETEVSDLGREFINEIRSNIHKLLQIQPVRSVTYRPNINAAVERIHPNFTELCIS
jgi:hypothetical protein